MKIIQGADFLPCSNISRTREAPTPTNISTKSEPLMEKNGTSATPAIARDKKIEKQEEQQNRREAREHLGPRMRFGPNGRLNSSSGEFVLQIAGKIQINRSRKRHLHVLLATRALPDVFAAQFLRWLAFLDEQGERRIFVVYDLLVLEQFEKPIIRHIFTLLIIPAPEKHGEGEKAERDCDQDDPAPVQRGLV